MIAHMTDDRISIDALEAQLKRIAEAELQQALQRLPDLSDEGRLALKILTNRIVQQVLATPQTAIEIADNTRQQVLIDTLHSLFNLE